MRDAAQMKHRVEIFQRIEAGMIAERPLSSKLVEMHVTFKNNFGRGRDLEINRFAFHQFDRLLAKKAGDQIFLNIGRRRNDGGESDRGISANGNRDFHLAAWEIVG